MDFLVKDLLLVMMLGNTHYVDVGKPDPAIIFYETETRAHMQFPDGKAFRGAWNLTDGGYYVDWTGGPKAEWRLARAPGRLFYVDAEGNDRGSITKIVPGDPAGISE
ncbi:MAG: hypothetical protein AAFV19_18020 [Pseudomonadota bacterium]